MSILNDYVAVDLIREDGKVVGANVNLKGAPLGRKMVVLGSTMSCSVRTKEGVTSFRVEKSTEPRGMVDIDILAVMVEFSGDQRFSDFIVVDWRDDICPFDLVRGLWLPWMSFGQIVGDRIDVTVGNDLFTTCVVEAQKDHWEAVFFLPDGDLLCSYLAKHIEDIQLRDNAKLIQEGIFLAGLANKLTAENRKLSSENEELTARLGALQANFWAERAECAAFQRSARVWYNRYQILRLDVLRRGLFTRALRRLVGTLDTGVFDPEGDKFPMDKDVLSCLPKDKVMEEYSFAP